MLEFDLHKALNFADGKGTLEVAATLEAGKTVALYGPSGAGKSTLLDLIAGLIPANKGFVKFNGKTWSDTNTRKTLKPGMRRIGMVHQNYTLFPNMSILENLRFALEKGQNESIIDELIEMVQLHQLLDKKVTQLSGGQKQRVAIARALVRKPNLLLLDEPFAALDQEMRIQLQGDLRQLQQRYQTSTILVSHDLPEIFRLADEVWHLQSGQFVAKGKPVQVFGESFNKGQSVKGEVVEVAHQGTNTQLTIWTGAQLVERVVDRDERLRKGDEFEL